MLFTALGLIIFAAAAADCLLAKRIAPLIWRPGITRAFWLLALLFLDPILLVLYAILGRLVSPGPRWKI